MEVRRVASALFFAVALVAPPFVADASAQQAAIVVHADLDYAAHAGGWHEADVYAPAGARRAPVLVWFFGGGRTSGSRKQFALLGRELAGEGIVFVAPGYRIRTPATPDVTARTIAEDAGAAIAWTQKKVTSFGGDPSRIVVGGFSAGAHVAALVTLDGRYIAAAGGDPRRLAGAFIMSGVLDARPIPPAASVAGWTHDFGATETERWDVSPLKYARKDAPPMEISCAQHDPPRFTTTRDAFVARMKVLGANVTTFTEENADHGKEFRRVFDPSDPLHREIAAFVEARAAVPQ
jgi:acetyl esterase/lipase